MIVDIDRTNGLYFIPPLGVKIQIVIDPSEKSTSQNSLMFSFNRNVVVFIGQAEIDMTRRMFCVLSNFSYNGNIFQGWNRKAVINQPGDFNDTKCLLFYGLTDGSIKIQVRSGRISAMYY